MVSGSPAPSNRVGRLRMLCNTLRPVRLASVNSSITRPSSAMTRKIAEYSAGLSIPCKRGNISMPATVNTMGAVTTVRSSRLDTRL